MSDTEPLGLKRGEVVVADYDQRWPILFGRTADELVSVLGPSILAVHHVGSTAVPGLPAKPILDVLVSIPDFADGAQLVPVLESVGYVFRPEEEIADRHYFRRGPGDVRTHHLSMAEPTSRHHMVTLAFRDALRKDAQLATAYADLKMKLAGRFPFDLGSYMEGKSDFVSEVLSRAGMD